MTVEVVRRSSVTNCWRMPKTMQWARAFVRDNPTDTLRLLKDLSAGVSAWVGYQSRED